MKEKGCTLDSQEIVRGDEKIFKEQFKQGRSDQLIQQIRVTTPPLGLPTGGNIGERSVGDIVNWNPKLTLCNHEQADNCIMYHCTLKDKLKMALDNDILILMGHVFASVLPDHACFYKPRKASLLVYLRFMIILLIQLQSRYQQCSYSPAVIQ